MIVQPHPFQMCHVCLTFQPANSKCIMRVSVSKLIKIQCPILVDIVHFRHAPCFCQFGKTAFHFSQFVRFVFLTMDWQETAKPIKTAPILIVECTRKENHTLEPTSFSEWYFHWLLWTTPISRWCSSGTCDYVGKPTFFFEWQAARITVSSSVRFLVRSKVHFKNVPRSVW